MKMLMIKKMFVVIGINSFFSKKYSSSWNGIPKQEVPLIFGRKLLIYLEGLLTG